MECIVLSCFIGSNNVVPVNIGPVPHGRIMENEAEDLCLWQMMKNIVLVKPVLRNFFVCLRKLFLSGAKHLL